MILAEDLSTSLLDLGLSLSLSILSLLHFHRLDKLGFL